MLAPVCGCGECSPIPAADARRQRRTPDWRTGSIIAGIVRTIRFPSGLRLHTVRVQPEEPPPKVLAYSYLQNGQFAVSNFSGSITQFQTLLGNRAPLVLGACVPAKETF
jgi:hypothetical protein